MTGAAMVMLDRETGQVTVYQDEHFDWTHSEYDGEPIGLSLWTDGNYACDCNRASFFAWATGTTEPKVRGCGSERYQVLFAISGNGQFVSVDGGNGRSVSADINASGDGWLQVTLSGDVEGLTEGEIEAALAKGGGE